MAVIIEDTTRSATGNAITLQANDQLFVLEGVSVASTDGVGALLNQGGTVSTIYGHLIGALTGIDSNKGSQTIKIAETGSVVGNTTAIALASDFNQILNEGTITGLHGIIFNAEFSGGNSVFNSGTIYAHANVAIHANLGDNEIINTGDIVADNFTAIEIVSEVTDAANRIENSGLIVAELESDSAAIRTGNASCFVLNSGEIRGTIEFGDGDDTYDGELGRILALVDGRAGDDTLIGGAGRETFAAGAGNDVIEGGGGRDVFVYDLARESGGKQLDVIVGFDARLDAFDLGRVLKIDGAVNGGKVNADSFTGDVRDALGPEQLGARHALLFTPDAGDFDGHTLLVVDANNKAGYQINKDYVFDLRDPDNLNGLDIGDFI
jgi:hypothetical protein